MWWIVDNVVILEVKVEDGMVRYDVVWYGMIGYGMVCGNSRCSQIYIEKNQTLYLFFCSSTFSNTTLIISNNTSSSLISVNHVTIYTDPPCNLVAFSRANSSFFPSSSVFDVISSQDLFTSPCILRNVLATAGSLVSRSSLLIFMICSYFGDRDSTCFANSYDGNNIFRSKVELN